SDEESESDEPANPAPARRGEALAAKEQPAAKGADRSLAASSPADSKGQTSPGKDSAKTAKPDGQAGTKSANPPAVQSTSAGSRTESPKAQSKAEAIPPKTAQAAPARPAPEKTATSQKPATKAAAPPFVDVASELDEDRKPSIHTTGNVLIKD